MCLPSIVRWKRTVSLPTAFGFLLKHWRVLATLTSGGGAYSAFLVKKISGGGARIRSERGSDGKRRYRRRTGVAGGNPYCAGKSADAGMESCRAVQCGRFDFGRAFRQRDGVGEARSPWRNARRRLRKCQDILETAQPLRRDAGGIFRDACGTG